MSNHLPFQYNIVITTNKIRKNLIACEYYTLFTSNNLTTLFHELFLVKTSL